LKFNQSKVGPASKTLAARMKNADARRGRGKTGGYVKRGGRHEHRVIAEQKIGRPLKAGEVVHHRDEIKFNNALENLAVLTRAEHSRLHNEGVKRNRPSHCRRGHALSDANVYQHPSGARICITCRREYDNAWKKARRAPREPRRPGPKLGYKQTAEHIANRFGAAR
jgi:hypothetical protein